MHEFAATQLEWRPTLAENQGIFLRVVRYDSHVWIRDGDRGTPGVLEYLGHDTNHQAHLTANRELTQWAHNPDITNMFSTGPHPIATLSDPEAEFLSRWHHHVTGELEHAGRPHTMWVLARGLSTEAPLNPGAAAVLESLASRPHTIDSVTGDVVGLAAAIPRNNYGGGTNPDGTMQGVGFGVTVQRLGKRSPHCVHSSQCCAPCATRQAELLAYFIRDRYPSAMDHDELTELVASANRLVRASR